MKKKQLLLALFAMSATVLTAQIETNDPDDNNVFNSHVFSFEKVEDEVAGGWYFQHADQYTATTDKAYHGDYSLKFSNTSTDLVGDVQVQGYYGKVTFAQPDVPAGEYTMSAMFWAEEESPSHIYMPFVGSSPNVSVDFDISNITKGEWVKVSVPVTMTDFTVDTRKVHIQVKNSETGTCYIDQIRLEPVATTPDEPDDESDDTKTTSLVDFFMPLEPVAPLVSEGIWGASNVLPRDTANGLEDATLQNWCYWDGGIVKGDDGKYHMFASRWPQSCSHDDGWKLNSHGTHAVSDNINGPYVDMGLIWPDWKVEDEEDAFYGEGSNVTCFKMHDGRYGIVTSETTPGTVFASDSPDGPFECLGEIQIDYNGYPSGLAHYTSSPYHMSNVMILPRPDGTYMIIARSMATMISEDGVCGPYKILNGSVYGNNLDLPQSYNEDPTVWYSAGMYHIVYNHWPSSTSYHFTSKDGITNWIYRGIAFKKNDPNIFVYSDGTANEWTYIERPTAVMGEDGHVSHFIFSVLDVSKGNDAANDNHGSKIVVVPFDGEAFDAYMEELAANDPEERVVPEYEVNAADDDNILNSHVFSFEKTGETDGLGWYFQFSDQYSITTDKAYDGESSLKFSNSITTFEYDIQIQGSYNNAIFAQPNIPDGYYTMSAMVWLEEDAPSAVYLPFAGSSPNEIATFDLSEVAKGEWVAVTTAVDITSFNESNDRKINVQVKNSETGTFYIDNIRLIERDPVEDDTPDYETNDPDDNNLLNSHVFSFEKVEDEVAGGWYFQHADQYTATTDKAYHGDYSLKFSNTSTDLVGDVQIQGYYGRVTFAQPDVPVGEYTMSAMFWAEEESPSHIYMPFVGTSPYVIPDFDISNIAKGEWVKVSVAVTMNEFITDDRRVHIQVKNSETGTCYIDQIRLEPAVSTSVMPEGMAIVKVKGGVSNITVAGAIGSSVSVINYQGVTIHTERAASNNLKIAIPTAGIYLVVVDGRAQKVVVE